MQNRKRPQFSAQHKKITLLALSLAAWAVLLSVAAFAWFVNHSTPKLDGGLEFNATGEITAKFATWYKPVTEILDNGTLDENPAFRMASTPVILSEGKLADAIYPFEDPDKDAPPEGLAGHDLKYLRPGDGLAASKPAN